MHTPSRSQLTGTFACAVAVALAGAVSASAAERLVLLEKYSASWCPHCASASQALAQLIADNPPDKFITFDAFIDPTSQYVTEWGADRGFEYYFVSQYPTAVFDGVLGYGGSAGAYDVYQQGIDMRAQVPTDVVLNVTANPLGNQMYDVTTSVSVESGGVGKTMRIHLLQALDDYGLYDADGVTVAHNTVMQVLETGFDVTVAPGQSRQITRTMQLGATSLNQFEDIRLIAWAQEPLALPPAEVFNAGQTLLTQAHPADFNADGVVSQADALIWESQFGMTGLPFEGADATGDGRADGSDLLTSQRSWGIAQNRPAAVASVSVVPEPQAAALVLLSVASLYCWRKHRVIASRCL